MASGPGSPASLSQKRGPVPGRNVRGRQGPNACRRGLWLPGASREGSRERAKEGKRGRGKEGEQAHELSFDVSTAM